MTDRTKKYFDTCGDEGCKAIAEWEIWFNEYGNHDEDGYNNFDDWFADCVSRGDLKEVLKEIKHEIDCLYHRENENGEYKAEEETRTETIYIFQYGENDFSYYANITENNGSGTWDEIIEEIEELLEMKVSDMLISLLKERDAEFEVYDTIIDFIIGNIEIFTKKDDTKRIIHCINMIQNR